MRAATRARRNRQPGVTPSTISGLKVWLKADDLSASLSNGAAVASWTDAASGLVFANATSNLRPIFQTNQINGLPAVLFDGTDDSLFVTSSLLTVNDVTVFIVTKAVSVPASFGAIFGLSSANWYCAMSSTSRMTFAFLNGSGVGSVSTVGIETQYPTGVWGINTYSVQTVDPNTTILARYMGASKRQFLVTTGRTTPTSTTIRVGRITSGSVYGGAIAEIVAFDRALTTNEIARVERYLGTKYNLRAA